MIGLLSRLSYRKDRKVELHLIEKVLHIIFRAENQRLIIAVSSHLLIKMLRANKRFFGRYPEDFL